MRMLVMAGLVAGLSIGLSGCNKGDGNPRLVNPPDSRLKPVKPSMGGTGAPKPADPGKDKPDEGKDTPKSN
jgi:hypothetical protein